jgi:hypothetical protein
MSWPSLASRPRGIPFEDALQAAEVIEQATVEDEEAGADNAIWLGLLPETQDLTLSIRIHHTKTRDRRNGSDRGHPAVAAVELD